MMKLLFADDERNLREILAGELEYLGHSVKLCANGSEAIDALRKDASFDVLLVDLDMPGAGGLEVVAQAKSLAPGADAVILTGKGTLESAIDALHQGVFDYLTKPYKIADLELLLQRIAAKRGKLEGSRQLVGDSEAMRQVQRLIDRVARSESTVVILGETGTGKELVARAVHDRSRRREKPFVAINCGALPENLIESELFGHRKGSFTGADANRVGLLEVANGGTLFLDEIGELPKGVQAKLLRFLESGEVRRIGENTSTQCNVRVVCATLRDLETMVRSGEFREDLWFRINTFEIHLPTLKERREDIPELIRHLAKRFRPESSIETAGELFTEDALERLKRFDWPGNVRQLANTIEHALILADEPPIGLEFLPPALLSDSETNEPVLRKQERFTEKKPPRPIVNKFASESSVNLPVVPSAAKPSSALPSSTTLRDLEMQAINAALQRNGGNKSKAAEELGISLKTLYNKLNQSEGKRTA